MEIRDRPKATVDFRYTGATAIQSAFNQRLRQAL